MPGFSWSDIPVDLQVRVNSGDAAVLDPLAAWLHAHQPRRVSEDVLQKVLSTLYRLMSSEPGRSLLLSTRSVPGLLASIASRHRSAERRTDARLRRRLAGLAASAVSDREPPEPITICARAELRTAIIASLECLRPIERDALVRAAVLGQSYKAIAAALLGSGGHRHEQRLRALVHRARRKLQTRLQNLGEV